MRVIRLLGRLALGGWTLRRRLRSQAGIRVRMKHAQAVHIPVSVWKAKPAERNQK